MDTDIQDVPPGARRAASRRSRRRAISQSAPFAGGSIAALPEGLAFSERATAALRAELRRRGLGGYRIFYTYYLDFELYDLEEHLAGLGELPDAAWTPLPALSRPRVGRGLRRPAPAVANVRFERDFVRTQQAGVIHLRKHEVLVARWFWMHPTRDTLLDAWLFAAATVDHYIRLRDELRRLRRSRTCTEWRIVTDGTLGERVSRTTQADAECLMLPDRLRERIDAEIIRFFDDEAAGLFKSMNVPYRHGVLLHGPPGNGKTSLIRWLGARLTRVAGIILRPGAAFDADDLAAVIRRWTYQAPCVLVIEDLDWLLKQVNVSAFLNLIDGVDSAAPTGGLLLLATTNHPDALDPAVNNRPGRFDVVIEMTKPDELTRLAYLRKQLAGIADDVLRQVAIDADGLSFAHLQEIVRLSGLVAINAGRAERVDADVRAAAETVREAYDDAVHGFPTRTDVPFGLAYLRRENRRESAQS